MSDTTYPEIEFIEFILKNILEQPDDIKIERSVDDRGVLITVRVNELDMPILIGRHGQTAKSIRTLLRVIGAKTKSSINFKIYDPKHEASLEDDLADIEF